MAGIGFRLRALGEQDNLLAPLASIGHAAVIAAGPWLFTVTALEVIGSFASVHVFKSLIVVFCLVVIYSFALYLISSASILLVAELLVRDSPSARDSDLT